MFDLCLEQKEVFSGDNLLPPTPTVAGVMSDLQKRPFGQILTLLYSLRHQNNVKATKSYSYLNAFQIISLIGIHRSVF